MTTLNSTLRLLQLQISQSRSPGISAFSAVPYHPGTPTLPAPQVPALVVHNGLNKSDLHDPTMPIAVQVVLQPIMLVNDELNLYLNDTPVAVQTLRPEHLESGIVTFYLAPSLFPQEGQVTLHYHHGVPPSNSFSVSRDVGPFLVKQNVPGDPDPDLSTPHVNEHLTPPTGIPNPVPPGRPLTVTIPRYVNIRENDEIVLHWSNQEIRKTVSAAEASTPGMALTVTVPADIIDRTPGLGLIVRYDIYDTVMNWSLYSLEAHADVDPPGVLHAPTVRDANDYDELDMDELDGDEVAIQIPVNGNLPLGTEGVLTWTGIPVLGPRLTFTLAFKIEQATTRITLMVPNDKAMALIGSTATVYYEALLNGVNTPSQRTSVAVIGEAVTLEKPTLTGVPGDNYNPALIVGSHQEVVVPAYGFMASGQAVILHWEGRAAGGSPLYVQQRKDLASDNRQDIHFQIEKMYATSLATNTLLKVYYEIITEGTTYASPTLELTVMSVPTDLPKPTTDPVFWNGEIDPGTVGATVQVVVQPNSSLQPGDLLTIHWQGRSNASTSIANQSFPVSGNLEVPIGKTPYIDGNTNGYVEVSYEARRNGQPVGSSQVLLLHVGAATELPWPLPKVVDATNGEVSTWQPVKPGTSYDSNTATIVVTDSRILAGDTVAIIWRLPDGTDLTVPWMLAGAGEGRVPVPSNVLTRSLGQTVQVGYVVFRGPASDLVGNSGLMNLRLGTLPAHALSELIIVEAANSGAGPEFDVNQLTGDATLRVGRWPMIEVGQPVWLTLAGTRTDGTAYSKTVLSPPNTVESAWASLGYRTARVAQAEAKALKDGSSLTVQLKVGIGKALDENQAVTFTPKTYTVRSVADTQPLISGVRDSKGEVANGGDTYDAEVTVSGTATANQDVELLDNGVSKGRTTVNANGAWSLGVNALSLGTHSLTAKALYGSGQQSLPRTFTRLADAVPTISNVTDSRGTVAPGGTTYDAQVTVSGTALPNQQVEVFDHSSSKGTATVNAGGNWSLGTGGLAIGAHSMTARARYGSGQSSAARTFTRANRPLVVDTSHLVLNGKIYINVAGGLPNPLPAGTSSRRSASGGVPPYQYASANSNVASVDGSGLVQSRGEGNTTITVSDSAGQRLSFTVAVSGVFLFRYAGSGQWYLPGNAGSILTRELMAEIWAQCAAHGGVAALGIPGGVYWTGTTSDVIRRYYTRNLSTGAEGTEAGQGIGTAAHHMLKRPL